jgi:hypothetical protein
MINGHRAHYHGATMRFTLSVLIAAMTVSGCQDRPPIVAPVIPQPAPNVASPRTAYLSVSDLTPEVGSTIVVSANVRLDESFTVASFVAQIDYDPTALYFMEEAAGADMMHVLNAQETRITVAAASAQGSSSGVLFRLRFRVDKQDGLKSLALAVKELNDPQFKSQLATVALTPSLRLDRSLAPTRQRPR